jgi:hypothetical protein
MLAKWAGPIRREPWRSRKRLLASGFVFSAEVQRSAHADAKEDCERLEANRLLQMCEGFFMKPGRRKNPATPVVREGIAW